MDTDELKMAHEELCERLAYLRPNLIDVEDTKQRFRPRVVEIVKLGRKISGYPVPRTEPGTGRARPVEADIVVHDITATTVHVLWLWRRHRECACKGPDVRQSIVFPARWLWTADDEWLAELRNEVNATKARREAERARRRALLAEKEAAKEAARVAAGAVHERAWLRLLAARHPDELQALVAAQVPR